MRLEIMKEFERAGELSLLNLAEHKEAGGKVAGVYCPLRSLVPVLGSNENRCAANS